MPKLEVALPVCNWLLRLALAVRQMPKDLSWDGGRVGPMFPGKAHQRL